MRQDESSIAPAFYSARGTRGRLWDLRGSELTTLFVSQPVLSCSCALARMGISPIRRYSKVGSISPIVATWAMRLGEP